jgi:hypothetical protein
MVPSKQRKTHSRIVALVEVRVSLSARSRLPCSSKAAPISGYEVHEPWGLCWAVNLEILSILHKFGEE